MQLLSEPNASRGQDDEFDNTIDLDESLDDSHMSAIGRRQTVHHTCEEIEDEPSLEPSIETSSITDGINKQLGPASEENSDTISDIADTNSIARGESTRSVVEEDSESGINIGPVERTSNAAESSNDNLGIPSINTTGKRMIFVRCSELTIVDLNEVIKAYKLKLPSHPYIPVKEKRILVEILLKKRDPSHHCNENGELLINIELANKSKKTYSVSKLMNKLF